MLALWDQIQLCVSFSGTLGESLTCQPQRNHYQQDQVSGCLNLNLSILRNIDLKTCRIICCKGMTPNMKGAVSEAGIKGRYKQLYPQCLTVHPKKYAHGFCFAVLCCGYTLTDFPISIRRTSLALWQSNDCPSASKGTLMNMDKYFMWIHYERLHNHNKAKHNKTVCIFHGIWHNTPYVTTNGSFPHKTNCINLSVQLMTDYLV